MSTPTETITGEGTWRITWQNHQVVMIQLFPDEHTCMTFGTHTQTGPCALCGDQIPTITTGNVEKDLCERCQNQVEGGLGH